MHDGVFALGACAEGVQDVCHIRLRQQLDQVVHEGHKRLVVEFRACEGVEQPAQERVGEGDFVRGMRRE
jgi:hypothetical protein